MSQNPAPAAVVVPIPRNAPRGPGHWDPLRGQETLDLRYPPGAQETIIAEAVGIIRGCTPPDVPQGAATGLVVGYVQSGKTMSFTTVAALARDNGYRMVVVITGIALHLLGQSQDRLLDDLRVNRAGRRPWRHFSNPSVANRDLIEIRNALDEWGMNIPDTEKRTVLITVMKHHGRLQNLIDVLRAINVQGVPTLIIDDEADQASLNIEVQQGTQSTTYERLLSLKNALSHHSYLQYTATPQAVLLINIIDVLSPGFAAVLTPGADYVGGQEFFRQGTNYAKLIPPADIPTRNNPIVDVPGSLMEAMRVFFLGATSGMINNYANDVRSMMVHPSQARAGHRQSRQWVERVRDQWLRVLDLPADDPDRADLYRQFREAYADLQTTVPDIPPFDDMMHNLPLTLRRTNIRMLNTGGARARDLNWRDTYPWILVGGQSMDRGFTVEGLTVTYMPRSLGVGNADTVQQRARFFGYKRSYLGYCRVYLQADVRDAFRRYLASEEDIRTQLIEHRRTGRPLSEWRRQFFSPRNLRPTRDAVIDIAYQRVTLGAGWHFPNGPHDSPEAVAENRELFDRVWGQLGFVQDDGLDRRQGSPRNMVARDVSLQTVHEELLSAYRLSRFTDSQLFVPMLGLIQRWLVANPDERCSVYFMANREPRSRAYTNDRIQQPFQGRQSDGQGPTYPGDSNVRARAGISVQISYLTLTAPRATSRAARAAGQAAPAPVGAAPQVYAERVPFLAIYLPAEMAQDAIDQPQGRQN